MENILTREDAIKPYRGKIRQVTFPDNAKPTEGLMLRIIEILQEKK